MEDKKDTIKKQEQNYTSQIIPKSKLNKNKNPVNIDFKQKSLDNLNSQEKIQLQEFSPSYNDLNIVLQQNQQNSNNSSFLSNHLQEDKQEIQIISEQKITSFKNNKSVETQQSTLQSYAKDIQKLSITKNIQDQISFTKQSNENQSYLNYLNMSQQQNLKLTNKEEKLKNKSISFNNYLNNQINRQKGYSLDYQFLESKDLFNQERDTNLDKINSQYHPTQTQQIQSKEERLKYQWNLNQQRLKKKQKKQKKNLKRNQKKKQKKKYINFVFKNITLDIHFHSSKAFFNGIEADLIFNQNSQIKQQPKYKHQEILYINCQIRLKQNIFGQKNFNCLIFRKNQYINKAIINNNIFYRNEKVNFVQKINDLYQDFFKLNFQIQNFQITLSFKSKVVSITEFDIKALNKSTLQTRNQFVGEFQQENFSERIVFKATNQYQQRLSDGFEYFISKYFVYQISFDYTGQMFIQSNLVSGYAKQIFD